MRHSYKGARSGTISTRGVCSRCGRHHPKGKKQREKAKAAGFSCRSSAIRKTVEITPIVDTTKRKAKNLLVHQRNTIARQERLAEAKQRKKLHDKLTPQEKLAKLDERLGVGVGAEAERQRLRKAMARTADGHPLKEGMTVWVKSTIDDGKFSEHIISDWNESKIWYLDPDPKGYEGAKLSIVYANLPHEVKMEQKEKHVKGKTARKLR